jgi:hypothetical protein
MKQFECETMVPEQTQREQPPGESQVSVVSPRCNSWKEGRRVREREGERDRERQTERDRDTENNDRNRESETKG